MKKFAISLLALAAVSTFSLASSRDVTTTNGAVDTHKTVSVSASNALAVPAGSNGSNDQELGGSNRR